MRQLHFNYYFIFSLLWLMVMFLTIVTDTEKKFIENETFLFITLSSMINIIILAFISTKKPIN